MCIRDRFRRYTFNEVADATKAWKEVLRRADAGAQGSGEIRRMFVLANDAEAIARAEQMEREGKPPEEIWRETHMGRDIKTVSYTHLGRMMTLLRWQTRWRAIPAGCIAGTLTRIFCAQCLNWDIPAALMIFWGM